MGALPLALRLDAAVVRKRGVNHAAVGGRHRVERDGAAAGDDALRRPVGERGELAGAPFAVALDVQRDARPAALPSAEREVDEELEGAERLPPVADQQPRVLAVNVDDGEVVRVVAAGAADGRVGVDVQPVEEALDDAEGGGCGRAAGEAADADFRVLGADAEDAGAPGANDVDFDFVAAYAEFQGCEFDRLLHRLGRPDEALLFHRSPP